jgi:hypothetical protein
MGGSTPAPIPTTPAGTRGTLTEVTEPIKAGALNDLIQAKHDAGGGKIALLSTAGWSWSTPIVVRPGVIVEGGTMPMIYSRKVRVKTTHSGPVFLITDDTDPTGGDWEAWGASMVKNFQVEVKDGQDALLQIEGGNMSDIEHLTSVGGKVTHTILVDQGRKYDGQYTNCRRVSSTRTELGLGVYRGSPDNEYRDSLWYGGVSLNSEGLPSNTVDKGVFLGDDVHNQKLSNTHAQFNFTGYEIGGRENRVDDGSWENKHSDHKKDKPYATIFKVRPSARDLNVTWLSLANTKAAKTIIDCPKGAGVTAGFSFTSPNRGDVVRKLEAEGMAEYVSWLPEIK